MSQKANRKRRGFSANTLCQLINVIYREAGLQGATSHSGRRGYITTLANHSVGIKTIMELAGHRQDEHDPAIHLRNARAEAQGSGIGGTVAMAAPG